MIARRWGGRSSPYLRYRGTWQIQSIYLSHLHDDHIQGLADMLAAFPVGNLYLPATSVHTPAYNQLVALIEPYGVPIYFAPAVILSGTLQVAALNPPPGPGYDENEDSLVLALQWPNLRALVPGDIGVRELVITPTAHWRRCATGSPPW